MSVANWSTSVLSGLSSDTDPTILVTFPDAKYVFNAGENISRTWIQSRSNMKKTKGLFLTSIGTQRTGGLAGLLMLIADASTKHVNIVGPQGLFHLLAAARLYILRKNMGVNPIEVGSSTPTKEDQVPIPIYTDQNITLYSIPIHPEISSLASVPAKRKREVSPASSSKRLPSSSHETPPFGTDPSRDGSLPDSLLERMRYPGFYPSSLRDEAAQEWRKLIIEHMFTRKVPPPGSLKESKGKKRLKAEHEDVKGDLKVQQQSDRSNLPRELNPRLCDKQLPTFYYQCAGETVPPAEKPTLAYILVGPKLRGKFDAKKALALGLEGKLRGRVANGEVVTFMVNDGEGKKIQRTVKPEDCVGPSDAPGVLITLDIPSPAYIPALVSSFSNSFFFSRFRSRLEHDSQEFAVHVVYHLCGIGVLEDERYKEFMRGFSPDTHHIVSSPEYSPDPITFTKAAFNQLRLNKLDGDMFRLPSFNLVPKKELKDVADLPPNVSVLLSNTHINMRPPRSPPKLDSLVDDPFHPAVTGSSSLTLPSVTTSKFTQAQGSVEIYKSKGISPLPGDDVTILPLGTASALPTKIRNVSGTLIRIPKWGNILLEAGEGSWGQLARYFGTSPDADENVWTVLRNIKCIFVSHVHGDHHLGLAKILEMRKKLDPPPSEPVYLITLHYIHIGLQELSDIEDLDISYNPYSNGVIPIHSKELLNREIDPSKNDSRNQIVIQNMYHSLGLRRMSTVYVRHNAQCYGVTIDHQDGWSIVFSGDTEPCNNLVEAGQNATLLIHEATMADEQVYLARAKHHSTVGEAIDVGKRMNAENILLTHFSARYPRMPPSIVKSPGHQLSMGDEEGPKIGLAFDHANIRLGDFWKLNMYLPAIEQALADTAEEGDNDSVGLDIEW